MLTRFANIINIAGAFVKIKDCSVKSARFPKLIVIDE
jgi:hypothetical protein